MYVNISEPQLIQNTIARNAGGDGAGVVVRSGTPGQHSHLYMTDTIVVSHSVGITVAAGCTATMEATFWGSGRWRNGQDAVGSGVIDWGNLNVWGDPAFVDSERRDYHLQFWSQAVDRGVSTDVDWDFDHETRPQGTANDIGADEAPAVSRCWLPTVWTGP